MWNVSKNPYSHCFNSCYLVSNSVIQQEHKNSLTQCIQEQQEQIEDLQSEINILKGED